MSIWWMPSRDHGLKGVKLEQRASLGSNGLHGRPWNETGQLRYRLNSLDQG